MAAHSKSYPALQKQPDKLATNKPRIVTTKVSTKHSTPREPIPASKAKAHLLQLLDEVQRDGRPIVITKRGRIVAQLIPASEPQPLSAYDQLFGRSRGQIKILGDIVSPDWEAWGPEWR
jgi:prevent-host-death family protein